NLGGIANITVLPRSGPVIAFDTGPGNMVIDSLVREEMGAWYDRGGRIAARGCVDRALLAALLADPYYREKPPKTAGREQFGAEFLTRLRACRLPFPDLVATATALTAATVAEGVRRFAPRTEELIVSGGGAHNPRILAMLASLLPGVALARSSDYGIDVDGKEAIAFAVLAHQTWRRRASNVPSATGARRAVVLGKVTW
ncbi:MAG: anhydro-N-acetylmuramic acid kinase, partial [Bryobacteraceae bacterium]